MFALLKVALANHDRSDSLIRAFEAGCAVHNSPQKPFGSCGYELIRVLALEFSLRTRTEAFVFELNCCEESLRWIQRAFT